MWDGRGWPLLGLFLPLAVALAIGLPPPQAGRMYIDSSTYVDATFGKPPVPFLFFAVFGTGYAACLAQSVLSIASWTWCGWMLLGALGACLGAAFALAFPIALWNCAILSESLALSGAAAAVAATLALAERWRAIRFVSWTLVVSLFVGARVANFLLLPFLIPPLLLAGGTRRRAAVIAVGVALVAAGLLWTVSAGEQERARLRLASIVVTRVLTGRAMQDFFVAHGMPIETAVERYRNNPGLVLLHREQFRTETPLLQAWLHERAASTYARWLLRWPAQRAVLAALPSNAPSEPRAPPFSGYATGITLRSVSHALAVPFACAAPPLWLWLTLLLVPAGAALVERRVRACDVLALSLAAGVYALAFAGYHGDAIEVDRHLLLARGLYRVVPLAALGCAARRVWFHG